MFEFELPDLGDGVAEGEVLSWHVAVGDSVEEDQVLADVETDKAVVDVSAPVGGVVRERHADVGEVVATGQLLVTIDDEASGDAPDSEPAAESGSSPAADRVFAPPSVRRLARETGVDITAVEGSGPSGRITEADVAAAADDGPTAESDDEDDSGPTSVVSKVSDDEDDSGPTSVVSKVSDDEDDSGPTSVVSKVDDDEEDSSPTAVISKVSDDEDDTTTVVVDTRDDADEPAVKSAVRRVSDEPMAERRDHTLATPTTRRLARELGVDIDAVPTDETRDGEPYVDAAAVRAVAEGRNAPAASGAESGSGEDAAGEGLEIADGDVREVAERVVSALRETADDIGTPVEASDGDRREPYRGARRTAGERMARSRREVPHATHHDKVAVPGLVEARERLQPLAEKRGVDLTSTPLVLKCVAAALDDHPVLATQLDTERGEIVYRSDRDIGVATATDDGLVVPVVEDVDAKGLLELADEVSGLAERARDIDSQATRGGVFTVRNFGAIGGEYVDPVINVPETAILGVGALTERPIAEDGAVAAKPTLTLSLAVDSRVVTGADAARFVDTLKSYLADPTRLLA
ncbi:2-oxo acid dehydrogenase subunit E2 [Haloarcula laminariae]|uniref:2-oxo acid dehydrogenase subunit E2 n=1 Tax=Haloarcula laminariae TaxID=2961577 RepID=UPI002405E81D|nr:2-oxo acid dehydrogenase subunit E2 [Halomicroarcula sp. FL173]